MHKSIRTLIADNDLRFSKSLKSFLDQQQDIEVVSIVRDGHGAIISCKEVLPDLVLIDLHLPVIDSVRAIQSILSQNNLVKVLAISSTPNDRYALEAIKAGAFGYVEKNGASSHKNIVKAIRQISMGEVVLNSTLAANILREFSTD